VGLFLYHPWHCDIILALVFLAKKRQTRKALILNGLRYGKVQKKWYALQVSNLLLRGSLGCSLLPFGSLTC
jgi:hypothetical protein